MRPSSAAPKRGRTPVVRHTRWSRHPDSDISKVLHPHRVRARLHFGSAVRRGRSINRPRRPQALDTRVLSILTNYDVATPGRRHVYVRIQPVSEERGQEIIARLKANHNLLYWARDDI